MRICVVFLLAMISACVAMAAGSVVEKPATATEYLESTTADFGVWFDPAAWKVNPHPQDLFSVEFTHVGETGYASLSAERVSTPIGSLPGSVLRNFRNSTPNMHIVGQETRALAGREVLFLTFLGTYLNQPTTFYGYYYSGPEGTVQLVVRIPSAATQRNKSVAEAFLSGLQISKPGRNPAPATGTSGEPATAAATTGTAPAGLPDLSVLNAIVPYGVFDATTVAEREVTTGDKAKGIAELKAEADRGNTTAECFLALCYDGGLGVPKTPDAALRLMKQASLTLPNAMADLGAWYHIGHLVPKDPKQAEKLLTEAANAGDAYAQAFLGQILLQADPKTAVGWYLKAANQHYGSAEFALYTCYTYGTGVPPDQAQALKWLKEAASHLPQAQLLLALDYWNGTGGAAKNPEAAAGLFRMLAVSGTAAAQRSYALCLWSGSGASINPDQALFWFHKAADQGDLKAELFLARGYAAGDGVTKNLEQAVQWYGKAANQGSAEAQYKMAVACYSGIGVTKDHAKALEWLERCAGQGTATAEGMLANLLRVGAEGIPANGLEALKWAQKAADAGNALGELTLGTLYGEGKVALLDKQGAFDWLYKAAMQGNDEAEARVGACLLHGDGVQRNLGDAVAWLRKAADQDHATAEFLLGLSYENGHGVAADPAEAVKWFRLSAQQGYARGENALGYALATGNGTAPDLVEACKWLVLASSQDKDADPKNRAIVNMNSILPRMTPAQIDEGKKRALDFVPKTRHPKELDDFSIGLT